MTAVRGRSSDLLNDLFGDTTEYSKSLSIYGRILIKKYPDKQLSKIFSNLGSRTITILPMAFCDAFSSDLGNPINKKILAAIGLTCVIVANHDDVVDEMPTDQKTLASLVYGGDIMNLYGLQILSDTKNHLIVNTLIDSLNQSHFQQKLVVDKLWQNQIITRERYFDAIKHWCTFCSIGPLCALAMANKMRLKDRVIKFATAYGRAFQLLDDLKEIDEDLTRGYKSIPNQEGFPYTETFKQIYSHIKVARDITAPKWQRVNILIDNIESTVIKLEHEIQKAQA